MNCSICRCTSHHHIFCQPCYHAFVKRDQGHPPSKIVGGGVLADSRSLSLGQSAENRFYEYYQSHHRMIRCSTKYENTKKHYDFIVFEDHLKQFVKIEVKAIKAKKRNMEPDETIVYIEILNIDGFAGWIYGEADYIAFQTFSGFTIVSRKELLGLVEQYLGKLPYLTESGVEFSLYGRFNRKDLVMVLPFSLLNTIRDKYCLTN